MTRALVLRRPLVVLDTETTGAYPFRDRIVELAMLKVHPDGRRERWERRFNPECRIPVEATAVHGITNADVEFCAPFRKVAQEIVAWIGDADLCGFNIGSFDMRILECELNRCGVVLDMTDRAIVDVQVIFHKREPRDLTAALRFYTGEDHAKAHAAGADVDATLAVLMAQLGRYPDLGADVASLASESVRATKRYIDPDRKLEWRDGEACFAFGRHAGRSLREVGESQPDYFTWILASDFPEPLKTIIRQAMDGRFPQQEEPTEG